MVHFSFVLLFRIVASIYAVLLTISDHQNIRVLIAAVSLVTNVLLNLWLVPIYGFIGAAYVSMITHFVLVSMYVYFSVKYNGSILIDMKIGVLVMVTIILVIVLRGFNLETSTLNYIILMLVWLSSIFLVYNKKQFNHLKEIFTGSYH